MSAGCERALQVDVADFLADPLSSRWREFRDHAEGCRVCRAEMRAWSELRRALGEDGDHLEAELLLAYADERSSLSEVELGLVESHRASCSSCHDELSVLESIRIEPAPLPATDAGEAAAGGVFTALWRIVWHPAFAYAVVLLMLVPTLGRWNPAREGGDERAVPSQEMARLERADPGSSGVPKQSEVEPGSATAARSDAVRARRERDPEATPPPAATSALVAAAPDVVARARSAQAMAELAAAARRGAAVDPRESRPAGRRVSPETESRAITDGLRARDAARAPQETAGGQTRASRRSVTVGGPQGQAVEKSASARLFRSEPPPMALAAQGLRAFGHSDGAGRHAAATSAPTSRGATMHGAFAASRDGNHGGDASGGGRRLAFVPGGRRRLAAEDCSGGVVVAFGVHARSDGDATEARDDGFADAAAVAPTADSVAIPVGTRGVELRLAETGGDRELRHRRDDLTVKAGKPTLLELRVPSGWLVAGSYRVTLHAGGAEVPVAEPFTLEITDENTPSR